ncbi:hypothetical protein ACHAPT_013115 [Fusarium lateritium]
MYDSEPDDDAAWLFLPVYGDEVITEIWEGMTTEQYVWSVRMKTSKNRIFHIEGVSYQPTSFYNGVPWTLVDQSGKEPSRVSSQCWTLYGISHLAFESPRLRDKGDAGSIRAGEPDIPKQVEIIEEQVFITSATLENLAKITPCRHADKLGISRMLLTYTDGHREVLGEIRLNGLQDPVYLTPGRDTMWLGFKHNDVRTKDSCPYVAEVAFTPLDVVPKDVLVVSLRGRLVWWWSCYQDCLIFEDQTSPKPVSTSPRD